MDNQTQAIRKTRLSVRVLGLLLALALLAAALPQPAQAAADDCVTTYEVRRRDTVRSIANDYGITASQLAEANNLSRPYDLKVGQELCIPDVDSSDGDDDTSTSRCQVRHTVGRGEDIDDIAAEYDVSRRAIANANDLVSPYKLTRGERLCIPYGDSGSSVGGRARLTASVSGSRIVMNVSNFAANGEYFVKVGESNRFRVREWFRIGEVDIRRNRDSERTFRLPNDLDDVTNLTLCLKNTGTDELICTQIYNP